MGKTVTLGDLIDKSENYNIEEDFSHSDGEQRLIVHFQINMVDNLNFALTVLRQAHLKEMGNND